MIRQSRANKKQAQPGFLWVNIATARTTSRCSTALFAIRSCWHASASFTVSSVVIT